MKAHCETYRHFSLFSLIALILLTFLWEWQIAPLRTGGSWMALKTLPLCLPLAGIWQGRIYTFQYASMLILFYLAEGVMRLTDLNLSSRACAATEIVFSLIFFIACLLYVRSHRLS